MKRFLLAFFVLSLSWLAPTDTYATHVSGGEITYENIGGDTFIITMTLYRDCSGIDMGNGNKTVRISSSCTTPQNLTVILQNPGGTEVSQICPAQISNSSCNGGSLPGMQKYVYKGQIVLGTNCSDYLFQYRIANRNTSVNVTNSNSAQFYIDATLNSILYPNNSSPEYTAPPIPYVCSSQTVNYNYGVVENNGDSLVYSLVGARTANALWTVTNLSYNAGYSASSPIPGITINSGTGELNFTPSTPLGNYIVVVQVTEYNGAGQVVGTVLRDIQFVVMSCANQIPINPTSVASLSNTVGSASLTDSLEITASVGDQFCFDIVFNDTNVNDTLFVVTNAASALPGSTVSISGSNPVTATVCWTVPPGMNTNNTITFQVSDSACPVSGVNSLAIQIIIPQPPLITGVLTTTNISCNGVCDGTASIVPSGGVGPYSYYWYPNVNNAWCCQGNDSITGMCAGTYILIVTDLGDPDPSTNTWDTIFSIQDAPPIAIIPPILVHDDCDTNTCGGSITAFAFGGTPPRNYMWSTGGTTNTITALCAGIYDLTVTDVNGCTNTQSYTIYEPTPFTLSIDSIDSVSCFGANDGAIFTSTSPNCGISTVGCPTPNSIQIGTGSSSNTSSTYPAPYGNNFMGVRHQILFTAAELTAANVQAGAISSLAFEIGTLGTAIDYDNFTIKMGCTGSNDLTGGWETGLIEVYNPKTHSVTLGWNTHDFDVAYNWDGISNIVVEVCFNNIGLIPNGNSLTTYTTTPNQSVRYYHANNDSVCSSNSLVATSANRPNVRFGNCSSSYTYNWVPTPGAGQSTPNATNLSAQTYIVSVTSNQGCVETASIIVPGPTEIIPTVTITNPISCAGVCDGEISVTSTGGAGGYVYSWAGGLPGDSVQTGLCVGTYYFTVTDITGCQKFDSIVITNPPPILGNVLITETISCNGTCDGKAFPVPSGGNGGPYTVIWPAGVVVVNDTATGLCGGIPYVITITDVSGCTNTETVTLTEPGILVASITLNQPISCGGVCDAQISAGVSGGTAPFSFMWSNGSTSPILTNLCAGVYTVTITDDHGCIDDATITILQPLPMVVTLTQVGNVLCNGDTNVDITANVLGGIPPYSYAWSTGDTIATITNLGVGTYTVTVSDGTNCTVIATQIVNGPAPLVVSNTINNLVQCGGSCNGSVTINVSGGTAGYTYAWPGGLTGQTQNTLCADTYIVTVTDTNMCSATTTFILDDPSPMVVTATIISTTTCSGNCDGEASVNATGGVAPITYSWPNGQTGAVQDSLCPGIYTVTATDSNLCMSTVDVIITSPNGLLVTLAQVGTINCAGDSNVDIVSTVTGGTIPYQYLWTNGGPITPNYLNVGAGTYTLVIADSNLCLTSATIVITEPDTLFASITIDQIISCGGNPTGELTANAVGGTQPYSYTWSNGDTTANISNLSGGTYTVTITDDHGCSDTASVTLTNPSTIIANQTVINTITCNSVCDGSVTYAPTGGVSPYVISWPTGITVNGDTATALCGGLDYVVTITDSNLCFILDTIHLVEPVALVVSINLDDSISCGSTCDANVTANISGGFSPFVFNWSNGLSGQSISGLCVGTYSVTVSDSNGCMDSDTIVITEPTPIQNTLSSTGTNNCFNDTNVTITTNATGGTMPYDYQWSNGDTGAIITGVTAGTYILTLTDDNGCFILDTIIITAPTAMVMDSMTIVNPNCGASDGSLEVFISGGSPSYTYLWNGATPGNPLLNIPSGVYNLLVTDSLGCTFTQSIPVSDSGAPVLSFLNTNVNCGGDCIGTSTVSITGTGPFNILWNNGDTTTLADSLCAGYVAITVIDSSNGCTTFDSTLIIQDTTLTVVMDSIENKICNDTCSGEVSVTVTSSFGLLSYTWNTGDTTSSVDSLCAGVYTVTVNDTTGCSAIDSITVLDGTPLSLTIDSITGTTCDDAVNGAIDITVTGGTPTYVFDWSGPNGYVDTVQNIDSLATGQYVIIVTDSMGCMVTDTAAIIPSNSLFISLGDSTLCDGPPFITLTPVVTGVNGTENYIWNNVTGDTIGTSLQLNFPFPADTTQFIVTVFQDGCTASDTGTIRPKPTPDVDAGANQTIIAEESVQLGGNPTTSWGGSTFIWTPNYELSDNTVSNPQATPLVTTLYTVNVTNVVGCTGSDTIRITVLGEIIIYSGFTPNGDGDNDLWNLPMLVKFPNVVVDVYNRWGEQLFHSEGYDEPWDGKYKGKDLPVGTYYYVIDLKDGMYPDPLNGPVTIMR